VTALALGLLWMLFDDHEPEMRIIRVPRFVDEPWKSPKSWRTR
jgi:hypothetical protein